MKSHPCNSGIANFATRSKTRPAWRLFQRSMCLALCLGLTWGIGTETRAEEPPAAGTIIIDLSADSIDENNDIGAAIGQLSATPELLVLSYAFSLVQIDQSTDHESFSINDQNELLADVSFDFEEKQSYTIRVRATVIQLGMETDVFAEEDFTITVLDVNEPPVFEQAAYTFTIDENSTAGTLVGTVVATDPDAGDALTYAFTDLPQNPAGVFVLDPATGEITIADLAQEILNSILNYELSLLTAAELAELGLTEPPVPFKLDVRVTDKGDLYHDALITIVLEDVNEPFTVSDHQFTIDINSFDNTPVGTIEYYDPDGDVLRFTILEIKGGRGADIDIDIPSDTFQFNDATLILANASAIDFLITPDVVVTVHATDGPNSKTIEVTVFGRDTNVPGGNPVLLGLPGIEVTDVAHSGSGEIYIVGPGAIPGQGFLTMIPPGMDWIVRIPIDTDFVARSVAVSMEEIFVAGENPTTKKARIYKTSLPVTQQSKFTSADLFPSSETRPSTVVDMALRETNTDVEIFVAGVVGTSAEKNRKHYYRKLSSDLAVNTGASKEWGFANVPFGYFGLGGGQNLNDAVGDVFALAVDEHDHVYVSGNWRDPLESGGGWLFYYWGYPIRVSMTGLQAATSTIYIYGRYTQSRIGYIARFNGTTGVNVAYTQDQQYYRSANNRMRVTDMKFVSSETGGALYVLQEFTGTSTLGHTTASAQQAAKLSRFNVNLTLIGPNSALIRSGSGGVNSVSLTSDPRGNIFVTGILPQGTVNFVTEPSTQSIVRNPTSQQFFMAKVTDTLNWDWVRILPDGSYSPVSSLALWYPYGQSVIMAGTLNPASRLTIRDLDHNLENTILAPVTAKGGFLTFLASDSTFVRRIFLEIESLYGDERHVFPHLGKAIGISGQTYTTSVPETLYMDAANKYLPVPATEDDIENIALKRVVNRGYTVADSEIRGSSTSFTFVLTRDTKITFHWDLEYALEIHSDLTGTGALPDGSGGWTKNEHGLGLTSIAAANPQPSVKKHWIKADELAVAFIDGTAADPEQFGTRYVATGYTAEGAAKVGLAITGYRLFPAIEQRQQIHQFAMKGPARITYQWRPQHRIQISTTSSRSETLPLIRIEDNSGQPNFQGSGDAWFNRGTVLSIAGGDDLASGQQLLGWLSSSGHFQTPIAAPNGRSLLETFELGGRSYRGYKVADGLTVPTRVLWNFGDRIFQEIVTIGNAAQFDADSFPSDKIQTPNATRRLPDRIRLVDSPPGTTGDDMQEWDGLARTGDPLRPGTGYPLRPGIYFMEWDQENSDEKVILEITSGFGGDQVHPTDSTATFPPPLRHYQHAAHPDLPQVDLDPDPNDRWAFLALKYSESDALVSDTMFTAQKPGRHVLLFTESAAGVPAVGDRGLEHLRVRVAETRKWDAVYDASDPDRIVKGPWTDASGNMVALEATPAPIGRKVTSALDTAELGTGFVVHPRARYNARIHDRTKVAAAGPIIPVNLHFTDDPEDDLIIIWYEQLNNILWPYQPAQYTTAWPDRSYLTLVEDPDSGQLLDQPVDRIVIASRLGSEGHNSLNHLQVSFTPARFEQAGIYHQPDRSMPGYNPNEEHALIAPSFKFIDQANPPPTAYALRTDLNVTTEDEHYTSDLYVLVEYFDRAANEMKMAVYAIEFEDDRPDLNPYYHPEDAEASNRREFPYTFNYKMKAGEPVQPPYPLGLVIGLNPCLATEGENITDQRVYWEDHRGQPWAVSDGLFKSSFHYPQLVSFWNGEGDLTVPPGSCVPFETAGPVFVTGQIKNPTFKDGSTFLLEGFPITLGGTDAAAFVYAVNAADKGVFAILLNTGEIRLESTDGQPFSMVDGDWTPLRQAGFFQTAAILATDGVEYLALWPDVLPILKVGETLTYAGGEYKADNPGPDQPGLPGVIGWASGRIIFDSSNPLMHNLLAFDAYSAQLISPLETRSVPVSNPLEIEEILQPAKGLTSADGLLWSFNSLPSSLAKRIFYDPMNNQLGLVGLVNDKTLGDSDLTAAPPPVYVLEPNILTTRERQTLLDIEELRGISGWTDAVHALYGLSRNPNQLSKASPDPGPYYVGLELDVVQEYGGDRRLENGELDVIPNSARHRNALGPGLALAASPKLLEPGNPDQVFYLTLVENDDEDIGGPVSLHIIKILKKHRYRGAIKTILSDNVFDERITLRHTGDFGANGDDIVYQWYYREENGLDAPLPPESAWRIFPDQSDNFIKGLGQHQITLEGTGGLLLADNLFLARYRHKDDIPGDGNQNSIHWLGTEWERDGANFRDPLYRDAYGNLDPSIQFGGEWAGAANSPTVDLVYKPQLAMGWIKRVLDRINLYEARFNDFRNNAVPATYASMVLQAGPRFEGPVALNPDKDVIENVGLIALYQTILERGSALSIDLSSPISTPGIHAALLLAATRIADLYMLLGNEAYADAQDPTIGFGSGSVAYGSAAPSIFAFQNQVASLLDEELGLLRGMSESFGRPVYNRLFWNFTKGDGEVAYAMTYNIPDQNFDGFLDESDALIVYPQGHGDAWGHYLTALKSHYRLLRHPHFNWVSRAEMYNLLDVVIDVDFLDERKFVHTAAARARAGAELVNLTYRSRYVEDPDGQWQGYTDHDTDRAWGVQGWARRAGQGALFDWITANSLIPAEDEKNRNLVNEALKKIDRSTVTAIKTISSQLGNIQSQYDDANNGLNPLGLVADVVPFDISPAQADPGPLQVTHFEQVYQRAKRALNNAVTVFDYATEQQNRIRQQQNASDDLFGQTWEQDRGYRNRLIEIFGTPYEGTIGTGKPYPAGYVGPDLMLFMYADVRDVSHQTVPPPGESFTTFWAGFPQWVVLDDANSLVQLRGPYFMNDFVGDRARDLFNDDNYASTTAVDMLHQEILQVDLPITAAGYTFQTPSDWGRRASVGQLQSIVSEMVQAEAEVALAVSDYHTLVSGLKDKAELLAAKHGVAQKNVRIRTAQRDTFIGLNVVMSGLEVTSAILQTASKLTDKTGEAIAEGIPSNLPTGGVAVSPGDALAPIRMTIKAAANGVSDGLSIAALWVDTAKGLIGNSKELIQMSNDIAIDKNNYKFEVQQALTEIEQELRKEATVRIEVFKRVEGLRQVSDKYRTTLHAGLALLDEREDFNKNVAGVTQMLRYQDMAFRVFRNDAIQKYRAAFDLAARYVYLAAKAYDYETNLDPNHPGSVQSILEDIVRHRTLGVVQDGQPSHIARGLAGSLAVLRDNYDVLKGQLGLNNPQSETGQFSLRHEAFRIATGSDNDSNWKQLLESYRVDDLWTVPEFRRYCRPPAPRSAGKQPGLVIPFRTEILFGNNFFGWPLGGRDHAYDPSHFATKVRSVGLWFQNYDSSRLSLTPRVYLVPAGLDVMAIPHSNELRVREWNVIDQSIPVPYPIGNADLHDPDWIPVHDSLSELLGEIRRFSSFRAYGIYGSAATLNRNELTYDTRLVGRSVWNTRWLLIIPGRTFHHNGDQGLNQFLSDVKDIKLLFETYGYSGN